MTDSKTKPHWSFWVITGAALIWNAMGALNFFMQQKADVLASMPASHQAIVVDRPVWATIGFGLTVFGGVLGCLLLLLRKRAAIYVFIAGFLGVIIQLIHTMQVMGTDVNFSPSDLILIVAMPVLVAGFLIGYARYTDRKEWLN